MDSWKYLKQFSPHKTPHLFILIVLLVIFFTKIALFIIWDNSYMIVQKQDSWHHMYTGIIIILISPIFPSRIRYIMLAAGLGLFLDEVVHLFHLFGLRKATDYWSATSIIYTIAGYTLAYFGILLLQRYHKH